MGKNVLIITGSPRRGGNTEILVDSFVAGAQESGHRIDRFDAAANEVKGCRACDACWSKGNACVFDDGFTVLAPMMARAEVLVLATPVYWFGFSAQLKAAVDKMYSFLSTNRKAELKIKESALLICAGDTDESLFTGSVETYKSACEYMEWQDRGTIIVPGVMEKGAIAGNPALILARELGKAL